MSQHTKIANLTAQRVSSQLALLTAVEELNKAIIIQKAHIAHIEALEKQVESMKDYPEQAHAFALIVGKFIDYENQRTAFDWCDQSKEAVDTYLTKDDLRQLEGMRQLYLQTVTQTLVDNVTE